MGLVATPSKKVNSSYVQQPNNIVNKSISFCYQAKNVNTLVAPLLKEDQINSIEQSQSSIREYLEQYWAAFSLSAFFKQIAGGVSYLFSCEKINNNSTLYAKIKSVAENALDCIRYFSQVLLLIHKKKVISLQHHSIDYAPAISSVSALATIYKFGQQLLSKVVNMGDPSVKLSFWKMGDALFSLKNFVLGCSQLIVKPLSSRCTLVLNSLDSTYQISKSLIGTTDDKESLNRAVAECHLAGLK